MEARRLGIQHVLSKAGEVVRTLMAVLDYPRDWLRNVSYWSASSFRLAHGIRFCARYGTEPVRNQPGFLALVGERHTQEEDHMLL